MARPSYGSTSSLQRVGYSGAAAVLFLLCFAVALLRHSLGAAQSSTFWPIFATLPIVGMRLAHRAVPEAAFWLAGGVLALGGLWYFAAQAMGRRALDAFLLALLAFQLFFVLRYGGSLLPAAGPLSLAALTLPQKINLVLQIVLLIVLFVWSTRPTPVSGYETSAPSRVTGFLKKRRLPWRIAGALLAALAMLATTISAYSGASVAGPASTQPMLLQPPLLFLIWLALDGLYLIGRTLWQRVH